MLGHERHSNTLASGHLHLWPIAIITRIKQNNLIALVNQAQKAAIQPFDPSIHGNNISFWINSMIGVSTLMELGNRLD